MQIYVCDLDWAGSVVVIADNETEARAMMKYEHPHYHDDSEVTVEPIAKGVISCNLGDC